MSKQEKTEEKQEGTATVAPIQAPILREDLAQIVAMVAAAIQSGTNATTTETAKALGKAIVEANNYKSPEELANEETQKENQRELNRRERANKLAFQSNCPHQKGSLGENPARDNSAFWRHESDTGLVVLICSACQKTVFSDTTDPEEMKYFRYPTNNRPSAAGRRTFLDPRKAQQRGRPVEYTEELQPAIA